MRQNGINARYTLIRRESKIENRYVYDVPQLHEAILYTNFQKNANEIVWYAEYENRCLFRQNNKINKFLNAIPIVNIFAVLIQYRKYDIIFNDEVIGYTSEKCEGNVFSGGKHRFIILNEEYMEGGGNTNFLRPMKKYNWDIIKGNKQLATIVKKNDAAQYEIEIQNDMLDITIIFAMIMMFDICVFSDECSTSTYYSD